jgi:hypothetical protein
MGGRERITEGEREVDRAELREHVCACNKGACVTTPRGKCGEIFAYTFVTQTGGRPPRQRGSLQNEPLPACVSARTAIVSVSVLICLHLCFLCVYVWHVGNLEVTFSFHLSDGDR